MTLGSRYGDNGGPAGVCASEEVAEAKASVRLARSACTGVSSVYEAMVVCLLLQLLMRGSGCGVRRCSGCAATALRCVVSVVQWNGFFLRTLVVLLRRAV